MSATETKSPSFSHRIRIDTVQMMAPHDSGFTQIHKPGCAHVTKGRLIGSPMSAAALVAETTIDDYYVVAPCARKA